MSNAPTPGGAACSCWPGGPPFRLSSGSECSWLGSSTGCPHTLTVKHGIPCPQASFLCIYLIWLELSLQSSSTAISCKAGELPAVSHTKVRVLLSWRPLLWGRAEPAPCMSVPSPCFHAPSLYCRVEGPKAQLGFPHSGPIKPEQWLISCLCLYASFLCPRGRKTQVSLGKATANAALGCLHATTLTPCHRTGFSGGSVSLLQRRQTCMKLVWTALPGRPVA